MIKRAISTLLVLTLLLIPCFQVSAEAGIGVLIDGEPVLFQGDTGRPFIDGNSRTLVPLRATMEAYGCKVFWDNENQKAVVYKDGVTVVCPIGESAIEVNGEKMAIDTAAVIRDNRTYLPIRCVLEAVGATVGWDGASSAVVVARGETGASWHQEAYIERVIAAIDENANLAEEVKIEFRAAAKAFLKAIPVTEAQITKMCSRLSTVKFVLADIGCAGIMETHNDGFTVGIMEALWSSTLLLRSIDPDNVDVLISHELNHLYSETPSPTWFQEGMTSMLNMETCRLYSTCNYEAYERILNLVVEICGADEVLPCFFTGNPTALCKQIDKYAGVSNSAALFQRCGDDMQFYFDNERTEQSEKAWHEGAEALTALFEKAYEGKYGSSIHDDALCEVYLSWLNSTGSLFLIKAESDFTCSEETPPFYYNIENYHSVLVINDAEHRMSEDGEFMYYRY